VVSTSALELGIDIGGIDCIIIAGYRARSPPSGSRPRAGRKLQDSLIIFVGFPGGLDQYLLHVPEVVLDRNFESASSTPPTPASSRATSPVLPSELPLRPDEVAPDQQR